MRTDGKTIIKAKKSRSHTEILCKYLRLPLKVKNKKRFDLIVSFPPMMMRHPSVNKEIIINDKKLAFNLHREAEIIFSSLRNLSDNGLALFIVSPGFLLKTRSRNIFEFINIELF